MIRPFRLLALAATIAAPLPAAGLSCTFERMCLNAGKCMETGPNDFDLRTEIKEDGTATAMLDGSPFTGALRVTETPTHTRIEGDDGAFFLRLVRSSDMAVMQLIASDDPAFANIFTGECF